jgi:hypothetical protein
VISGNQIFLNAIISVWNIKNLLEIKPNLILEIGKRFFAHCGKNYPNNPDLTNCIRSKIAPFILIDEFIL